MIAVNRVTKTETVPQRTITVRLPAPLHRALRKLSYQRETSINRLCVSLIERAVERSDAAALFADAEEEGTAS